ncbi:hypothetical protein [Agrobacterium tumefaciens]|uniref:hypothetical protein n=1 Tax=Agrobacterium tumefaciens TaxID=358 RepID=UPI000459B7CF|nr:hypothetical protein [Agrobacterium tumefaciens]CDN96070.1 hypothetical protein BN949_05244 [Agrobacterium tumefaciens]
MKISVNNEYMDVAGRKVLIVAIEKNRSGMKLFLGYQIDRNKNRIGHELWFKSDGKSFIGGMEDNLCREADSGMVLSDMQAVILERIIEAIDTDMAMPGGDGPRMYGSTMPDYIHDPAELKTLEFVDEHSTGGMHTRHRNAAIDAVTERRAKCSKARIGKMEEALGWVPMFVWDHEMRVVLFDYARVKAKGWDWTMFISARNRRNPQKKAWVKRTLYRWIEKSLQQIECGIINKSILLMDTAGLQVAHGEAKHAGKSITSGLRSWTASEDKPAA